MAAGRRRLLRATGQARPVAARARVESGTYPRTSGCGFELLMTAVGRALSAEDRPRLPVEIHPGVRDAAGVGEIVPFKLPSTVVRAIRNPAAA